MPRYLRLRNAPVPAAAVVSLSHAHSPCRDAVHTPGQISNRCSAAEKCRSFAFGRKPETFSRPVETLAAPYFAFRDAGVDLTLASPKAAPLRYAARLSSRRSGVGIENNDWPDALRSPDPSARRTNGTRQAMTAPQVASAK